MGYIAQTEKTIGGSMKEPLLEEVEGKLDQIIKPGDQVFTFTQVYGRGTRISSGIYRGIIREERRGYHWEHYVVERKDGKRTKLHYNGMVLPSTSIADLDDMVV
jgi:hypothetical protein